MRELKLTVKTMLLAAGVLWGCQSEVDPQPDPGTPVTVECNESPSYSQEIDQILQANCAISNCHNGDLGASRNWTVFSAVKTKAEAIKSRTGSGSMPPEGSGKSLTQAEIDLIACWVDFDAQDN